MVFEKKIFFKGKNRFYYYLVGAIKGDGTEAITARSYGLRLYAKDEDFHKAFVEAINGCFDEMNITENIDKRDGLKSTCFYGNGLRRIFHDDLKEINWIKELDDGYFCALMRGFFDAEGSYTHQKSVIRGYSCNHQHLQMANTDYELMKLLGDECLKRRIANFKLSIYPARNCLGTKDKIYLRLHSIEGIKRFFLLIGSSIRRKVPSYC